MNGKYLLLSRQSVSWIPINKLTIRGWSCKKKCLTLAKCSV